MVDPEQELAEMDWFARDAKAKFEKYILPHREFIDSYLEIGVAAGHSMMWVCDNLAPTNAIGVDDYGGRITGSRRRTYEKYHEVAKRNLEGYVCDLKVMTSKAFLGSTRDTFDLIYADGTHSGYGAMMDWVMSYEQLTNVRNSKRTMVLDSKERKVGGILVIDDLHRSMNRGKVEVSIAYNLFVLLMEGRMREIFRDGRQAGLIRID